MGQYYTPILLSDDGKKVVNFFNSHRYGNGLKLMEHSYLGNAFVNAVINKMMESDKPKRLVWAGDYADEEPNGKTLYDMGNEEGEEITNGDTEFHKTIRFCVNETKKEFVDLWNLKEFGGEKIHPLPLLTCEGNGRGGGDYHGLNMRYVGTWARDEIRFQKSESWWDESLKKAGYTEIIPNFVETYELVNSIKTSLEHLSEAISNGEAEDEDIKEINDYLNKVDASLKVKTLKK